MRRAIVICSTVLGIIASVLPASSACASTADVRTAGVSAGPRPGNVVIDLVTANGSGCPPGSAQVALSPDNTTFTVIYSKYIAQVGPGSAPGDFRKNCQLIVRVHVPQGFTYAIAEADYRGFAQLQRGANAVEGANYYFQGMPQTKVIQHTITGPITDNWRETDKVGVFAPCGAERFLNVNTSLFLNAGTSGTAHTTSLIRMRSSTIYHLSWKRCG